MLLERETARAVERLAEVDHTDDPIAALRRIAERVLDEQRTLGALELELVAEAARDSKLAQVVRRSNDTVLAALVGALEAGQAAGAFDAALDAQATARCLLALVDGLCYQQAVDPGFATRAQLDALDHLLHKLLAPTDC